MVIYNNLSSRIVKEFYYWMKIIALQRYIYGQNYNKRTENKQYTTNL